MRTFTKDNPGCYHSMLKYLASKTGISETYNIPAKDDDFHSDVHYILRGTEYRLHKLMKKGGIPYLFDAMTHQPLFPLDTKFDRKYIVKKRKLEDFNYPVHPAGKYKDCNGGGWYSMVPMYRVDDQYFAMF